MTKDLEHLVQAAGGQAPSAAFVARLRAQIVAETEGTDPVVEAVGKTDDDVAVVLELAPSPEDGEELATRRPSMPEGVEWLAAAAVVALAFMSVWALISALGGDGQMLIETADIPTPTAESADPDDDDGSVQLLSAGNTFIDAGTFRIDTLGTAFTFSVDETTGLFLNENGVVSITDLTSVGADDRTITLRRTAHLPDPSDVTAIIDPVGSWPANDLRGWVDAVSGVVATSEPIGTTLGGFDATVVDLEVGELSCTTGDCASAAPERRPDRPLLSLGSAYRLWVVDQGDEDPLVVTVAVDDPDEADWFDRADAILATLEFESVQPNPVRQAAAGPAELDVFGGIAFDLPGRVVIVEPFDGFARILPSDLDGDIEFLTRPLDPNNVEVIATDQLLQLLSGEGAELTELDSLGIGDLEARYVQLLSGPFPSVVLNTRAADLVRPAFGWEPPQAGHLWIIEHPDRGLLLVSAGAYPGFEAYEPLRSWTEDLLRSVEFERP